MSSPSTAPAPSQPRTLPPSTGGTLPVPAGALQPPQPPQGMEESPHKARGCRRSGASPARLPRPLPLPQLSEQQRGAG